jgi:hypothetical protein
MPTAYASPSSESAADRYLGALGVPAGHPACRLRAAGLQPAARGPSVCLGLQEANEISHKRGSS